jgi:ATP-dependent Lon protease
LTRVRFLAWTQTEPFRIARIEIVPSVVGNAIEAEALGEKVKEFCTRFEEIGTQLPANLIGHLHRIESPEVLADVVAAAFVADPPHRQQLLEAVDVCARLRLLIQFLRKQLAT